MNLIFNKIVYQKGENRYVNYQSNNSKIIEIIINEY